MPGKNTSLGGLEFDVMLDLDELKKGQAKLEAQLNKTDKKVSKMGKGVSDIGAASKKASEGTTVLGKSMNFLTNAVKGFIALKSVQYIIGFFSATTKAAIEFESAFAGVIKTVDGLDDGLGNLTAEGVAFQDQLRALALEIPIPLNELAKIAELGGQLGVPKEALIEFTRVMALLGETTNLTSEAAATSFAQIANVMQTPLDEISNMASSVVFLGNNFATTEAQIVNFSQRIASAGTIVGLTESEVLGISAAFTSVGIDSEAGGTSVSKALRAINDAVIEGGEEVEGFATLTNTSAEEFVSAWEENPAQVFTDFVEGLGESGDYAGQVLDELVASDARVQLAFLSLASAGDLLRNSIDGSTEAFVLNNALQQEAKKRFNTTESKLSLVKAKWMDWGITIGNFLKRPWASFLQGITNAAQFIPVAIKIVGKALNAGVQDISNSFAVVPAFFQDLGENIVTFGKRVLQQAKNIGTNLKKALTLDFNFVEISAGAPEYSGFALSSQRVSEAKEAKKQLRKEMADFINKSLADYKNGSIKQSNIEAETQRLRTDFVQKSQADIDKILAGGGSGGRGGGGGRTGKSEAQKRAEKEAKESQKMREESAKEEVKLKQDTLRDLEKEEKDYMRRIQRTQKRGNRNRKEAEREYQKELNKTEKDIEKIEKAHTKMTENVTKDLRKITNDIMELDQEYQETISDLKKGFTEEVAESIVDLNNRIKELKEERKDLKIVNEDDLKRSKEIKKEIKEIKEEIAFGEGLVSKEAIKEAERFSELTGIEKLKEEYEREKILAEEKFEKEKSDLEERQAIFQAYLDGNITSIENASNFEDQLLLEKLQKEQSNYDERKAYLTAYLEETTKKQLESLQKIERANKRRTNAMVSQWNEVKRAREQAMGALATAEQRQEKIRQEGIAQGFSRGGQVRGAGGHTDDKIPALLSNEEYVVNARSARAFLPILEMINRTNSPARFAGGGMVGNSSSITNNNRNITVNGANMNNNPEVFARQLDWYSRYS